MRGKKVVERCTALASHPSVLECAPKKVVLSGPSGFLGAHVLDSILEVHAVRQANGLEPGEVILMSSSPGHMMNRLSKKYGDEKMKTIRASRVDYFTQHEVDTWRDQLGSLGTRSFFIAKPCTFDSSSFLSHILLSRFERGESHLRQSRCDCWSHRWQAGIDDGRQLQSTCGCGQGLPAIGLWSLGSVLYASHEFRTRRTGKTCKSTYIDVLCVYL